MTGQAGTQIVVKVLCLLKFLPATYSFVYIKRNCNFSPFFENLCRLEFTASRDIFFSLRDVLEKIHKKTHRPEVCNFIRKPKIPGSGPAASYVQR